MYFELSQVIFYGFWSHLLVEFQLFSTPISGRFLRRFGCNFYWKNVHFNPNRTGGGGYHPPPPSCFPSAAAKRLKQLNWNLHTFYIYYLCMYTLNQSILKGKKREGKEYSEGLRLSFVRYYPIRFYGLQEGRDSDWLIFKTSNSHSPTAPPGNLQYVLCLKTN